MLKNIIFDIGNTLLAFDEVGYLSKKFKNLETIKILQATIFWSEEWNLLDKATLSEEEVITILGERQPNLKEEIREVIGDWLEGLTPMEESIQLLKTLREKAYKIYFLSNFYEKGFLYMLNKYAFLEKADGYLISFQVKLIKPGKEIYEALLTKFNLKPEECLFLDDLEVNLEAGRRLGIKGINIKNLAEIREVLAKASA
jgi:FMN phosphatase YigB (HAD superfamily)